MFTDELVVLMTIEAAEGSTKKSKSRPAAINSSHTGYLCHSLVRHGYLTVNDSRGYQVTSKGRDIILWEAIRLVSDADGAGTRDRIEKLERLYSEISRHIEIILRRKQ